MLGACAERIPKILCQSGAYTAYTLYASLHKGWTVIARIVEVFDTQCIRAPRPSWAGKRKMVEAGGQLTRSFHCGLDYAFILAGHPASMRSVLSGRSLCSCLILVLALNPGHSRRVYESLQGRPEVGPLPTPRRCHATVIRRRRQVSPM